MILGVRNRLIRSLGFIKEGDFLANARQRYSVTKRLLWANHHPGANQESAGSEPVLKGP